MPSYYLRDTGSLRFSIRREGSGLATFRDCAHRDDGSWSPIGYTLILTTEERKTKIELRVQTLSLKTRKRYVEHTYEHEVRNFAEPLLIANLPPVFTQTTLKTCGWSNAIHPATPGWISTCYRNRAVSVSPNRASARPRSKAIEPSRVISPASSLSARTCKARTCARETALS